jgi:hypothetical protein
VLTWGSGCLLAAGVLAWVSAKCATKLAAATTIATSRMTPALIRFARLDARLAGDREGRAGVAEELTGGVFPGAGAQGTKDGPLGVGPMPVLFEPLGSSISDHGSAGFPPCRPRDSRPPECGASVRRAVPEILVRPAGCCAIASASLRFPSQEA